MSLWPQIEKVLLRVEKPGRYVGAEIGSVAADEPTAADASIVLAFPDIYEIGASYHGFRILYERINDRAGFRAERAFAPWTDFEREMRTAEIPLFTIESFRPVREFDVIGFTLQHEMNYTNLLNMLDLAGLPLRSSHRPGPWPLVIAGGEGAFAPELMAPFIDAFVLGDGEEVVLEILECVARLKKQPSADKADCLEALARIPGLYVPAFIEFDCAADGTIAAIRHVGQKTAQVGEAGDCPARFRRRVFDLASDPGPTRPVVPLPRIVHDRLVIEIRRGCARGCRFCSSGMVSRHVRERPVEQVVEIAERGLANTGYRDLSLLSLSSGDHSQIVPMVERLTERFGDRMVSVSLPSLRISTFDVQLAERISEMRKTGFTFAPEAGTERLRRVINKPLADEAFVATVEAVFRAGWRTIKFYFMIGLPTETDTDLDGIVEMVRQAGRIGRSYCKGGLTINVTLAPFVPKPHTPFQWEPQLDHDELARRYRRVAGELERLRSVSVKRHSVKAAFIEAALARGDRRLADALERAWRLGCRLDAWGDQFQYDLWMQAFAQTGIDPAWYANRARAEGEILPWDHIDAGPTKSFLIRQSEAARRADLLEDCTGAACTGCQACDRPPAHRLAGVQSGPPQAPRQTERNDRMPDHGSRRRKPGPPQPPLSARQQPPPVQRVRLSYSKTGRMRFLSHLDMVKTWQLLIERAGLPMAYSRGFHPVALLQYSPPLSLGYAAEAEWVDIFLRERAAPEDVARRLDKVAPEGMRIFAPLEVDLAAPALDKSILAADYEVKLAEASAGNAAITAETIEQCWQDARATVPTRQATANSEQTAPSAAVPSIDSLEISSRSPLVVRMRVRRHGGNLTDPLRLLRALLKTDQIRAGHEAEVTRIGLIGVAPSPTFRFGRKQY